jgi:ankyrin repeat protein
MSSPLFALSKSTKPRLPVISLVNRANLYGDQAALRIEICNLGPVDEFLEIKQELQQELPSCLVDAQLSEQLKEIAQKIQSLHQFYVPTLETTRTHIKEMLSRLEKVQKPLTQLRTEKVGFLFLKLGELYRQAENQLEKESPEQTAKKFECTLVGSRTGFRYPPLETMNQIVPLSKEGGVARTQVEGSRPVNRHGEIYWKVRPSAPLCERAFHLMGKIFCSISSAPSEFVILQRKMGAKQKTLYTQASRAVNGIGMHKVLREYPDWIVKFDPVLYGFTHILHMLGNPQDAKPDNSVVTPEKNADGAFLNATWKCIDEDQSLAHTLCRDANGVHFVNVRSIYFNLPQVYQPIHPVVEGHFATLCPASSTLQWLLEIWEGNQSVMELRDQGHISSKKMQKMQLPFLLLEDWVPTMYDKLVAIQHFMIHKSSGATYMDLLKKIIPELGYYYDLTNKKYPGDPLKAFLEVFGANSYEEAMESMMGLPLVSNVPLSEYLKKSNHGDEDYETQRNTPPEKAAEQFLERLDFHQLSSEDQKNVMNILHHFPLSHITLRNCSLDDEKMLELMRSQPRLQSLKLVNCSNLTDATLQLLPAFQRRLRFVVQDCSGFSAEALASLRGYFSQVDITDRRESILGSSGLFKSEVSEAFETAMHEISVALDQNDWKEVQAKIAQLTEKSWVSQATILIVERLMTTDLMTTIVKEHRTDLLDFFFKLQIPLSQKNSRGETFLHLCCDENNLEMLKWLCSHPIPWSEMATPKGFTPCHAAVKNKNIQFLETLMAVKAPFDSPAHEKITPLHLAIMNNPAAAKILIQAGANLRDLNHQGKSPLHLACQAGNEELVELLLNKDPTLVEIKDWNRRVPLFAAIESKSRSCCQRVCARMKSLDTADNQGTTPLMCAVQVDPQVSQFLLEKGADARARDGEGMTAAHVAALSGSLESLKKIIGSKPSIDALSSTRKDKKGLLHLAAISGNENTVRWLCDQGLSMTQKDEREMTPAHYAAAAGRWNVLSIFISRGFPVEYQDSTNRETCLMLALKGHHFELVEKLLQAGASLTRDNWGIAPIHTAAKEGDCVLIKYLCEKQKTLVNFPSQNDKKSTPLHLAAAGGQLEAVKTLVALGAPLNARDRDGKTPLHFAFQNGHEQVAKYLLQHAADITLTMNGGWTCLHYAAKGSFPSLVELSLSLQPSMISVKTHPEGHSPLHSAMYQELPQTSKARSMEQNQQKSLQQVEVIKILLRYGADVDALDNFDYVPLHLAVRNGRLDFAQMLLNRGARKDVRNKNGNTPIEQGQSAAEHTAEEDKKRAILAVVKYLQEQQTVSLPKKAATSQDRAIASLSQQPVAERKKSLISQLKEDQGFRRESITLMRSLEAEVPDTMKDHQSFQREFLGVFQEWKQPLPQDFNAHSLSHDWGKMSLPALWEKYLQEPSSQFLDEWMLLFPFISPVPSLLQICIDYLKSKKLTDPQLQAIAKLIQHLQSHEAFTLADFPGDLCSSLAKTLDKHRKGSHKEIMTTTKDFIADPKTYLQKPHPDHEWKRSGVADRRQKLLSRLTSILGEKTPAAEKEALLDHLTLSIARMHKEWFSQLQLSDLRPFTVPSQSTGATALTELKRSSEDLTGNCLIFLLHDTDAKKFLQRFEFVIDWTLRSLVYGDYHQAFSLYRALSHPAVLRIQKARRKIQPVYIQHLNHFESLFSPTSNYQNYFSHLHHSLLPAIPAFGIVLRLLGDKPPLAILYALLRQTQHYKSFAKRLILPHPAHFSEYQLLLSSDLYPAEGKTKVEKEHIYPGEGFAWDQSRKLEPPK